jgi:hypothetical protein
MVKFMSQLQVKAVSTPSRWVPSQTGCCGEDTNLSTARNRTRLPGHPARSIVPILTQLISYNEYINAVKQLETQLLTYLRIWALLQKLLIVLLSNFPAFYGTRRFIAVFTGALHWSLSWARLIQSFPSHRTSLRPQLQFRIYLWIITCGSVVVRSRRRQETNQTSWQVFGSIKKTTSYGIGKNVFTLHIPPWAPHTYDFVVLTSLTNPSKKNSFVLQIGK